MERKAARVQRAYQMVIAGLDGDRPTDHSELAAVKKELVGTEEALERYFRAFESGSMPESQCGPRIRSLADRLIPGRRSTRPSACPR
jgi:hypothetical protein